MTGCVIPECQTAPSPTLVVEMAIPTGPVLADARRWRWQPRQRCGWSYGLHGVIMPPGQPG